MKELHAKGFGTLDETARQIIKERVKVGLSPRPSPADFATQMFERDLENFSENLNQARVTFFDRSILDSAALVRDADVEYSIV